MVDYQNESSRESKVADAYIYTLSKRTKKKAAEELRNGYMDELENPNGDLGLQGRELTRATQRRRSAAGSLEQTG